MQKRCRKCKRVKSITEFEYFSSRFCNKCEVVKPLRVKKFIEKTRKARRKKIIEPLDEQGSKWKTFKSAEQFKKSMPMAAGCYIIYSHNKISYIGSTINLRTRINMHIKITDMDKRYFVKVRLSEKYGDWAMREIRLLRRLKPKDNTKIYES
ncbi:hypothetical protein LCGC14_0420940 [marine sediment metagenome]|uniref:GIY-YIG domain-containing protein n=1 Tax=marine sediment metagenome TaxID=412755 RepID=A0A0F9T8T8_9ZZZZ